jgi:thioesterase domain-containing protein
MELESTWRQGIPLAAAMGIEVVSFADDELVVRAALAPNVNVHGTAFAGSLYSICALAAWGAIWLQLRTRGLDGLIVLSEAHIDYLRPVEQTIICRCRFDTAAQAPNIEQLQATGNGLFPLVSLVEYGGRRAARFEGEYAVKLRAEATARPEPASLTEPASAEPTSAVQPSSAEPAAQ